MGTDLDDSPSDSCGGGIQLVDIATGQDIWKSTARDEFDPTVTGGGGPVTVMDKDLRVPARRLTAKALKSSENGLPYGHYH